MPALPGGHVQIAVCLIPRRDRESLGGAESRPLHARHVGVAGQQVPRHVEPAREHGHGGAERMPDRSGVYLAPGSLTQRAFVVVAVIAEVVVNRGQQQCVPVRIFRG